ncbi:hypothetical protein TBLA_0G00850 [Henningerozyma blattae CBS 6284]|uniref:Pyridoxamine kinase/Phosphomethylpyrimidine kinase domain-containing protein n=1 Tax=Henningerozyma blattae (strain ATCC 34711 / CBS 6284 / DSM 70876 / NBRC 10599 / NRRL Y-10934 / UCD 77-7) TaxID=1071380 RepID=I2H6N0_HENB6|nr:hypothetical protein TBLA_0G00850 [Tetrapisispora blattae CBS 6284]CCH62032.1 hypothetical protein TBLA_0G00850 [Tetrapisispora blattae CBS 6284]
MTRTVVNINTPPPYLTLSRQERLPTVLTIAGSDSSGGAGIEADLKTFTAHRCYGMSCIVALTVQTPSKVYNIQNTPKKIVKEILDANLKDMRCDAIKCGMLTSDAIEALNEKLIELGSNRPKLIVDPVLVATSGSSLAGDELVDLIKTKITPFADLITPNIPEALRLINKGDYKIQSIEELFDIAQELSVETKCDNILVKGGHLSLDQLKDNKIIDVLYLAKENKFFVYSGNHEPTCNTHGTGCTLSSSIASNLARGYSLPQSVYGGIEYVQNAISIGCDVTKKHITDNGPINHVYSIEVPMEKMIKDDCFAGHSIVSAKMSTKEYNAQAEKEIKNNFFEYLIKHPIVKPHWDSYINHNFVKQVAEGTLEPRKFQFFVEQDYTYLVDYARVHCIAASKSPDLADIEKELVIVGAIKHEVSAHQDKLKRYFGIKDDSYFSTMKRGTALNNYSRYFNDVAKRGNWEELVAALTPCLMGYGYALITFNDSIKLNEKFPYYLEWCDVYRSENYTNAMKEGVALLNQIARSYPFDEIDTLVKIFADVCELETKFWDAAVEFEE